MISTITILGLIFAKVVVKNKSQRNFLEELFRLLPTIQGRFNFCNMARYSIYNELSFRRNFSQYFAWVEFNFELIQLGLSQPSSPVIAAIDASYISKSGKHTFGIDNFWSGCAGRNKKGLEVHLLALIETSTGKAWSLDITQTPSGLSNTEGTADSYTRINFYIEQLLDCQSQLSKVKYIVGDGYYAKSKMFNAVVQMNKHLITKLRPDSDMKYKLKPEEKTHGNQKYGKKVNWKKLDLEQWISVGTHPDNNKIEVYTQELYHVRSKRYLKVVLLIHQEKKKYVLLASTDIEQSALEILTFYGLRFQIEFLFRDAKQFTGLNHCQARDEAKLDFHFNMSVAAINLYQLQMQLNKQNNKSMNSFVRKAYNTRLVQLLFSELNSKAELKEFLDIEHPSIQKIINLGQIQYKKTA